MKLEGNFASESISKISSKLGSIFEVKYFIFPSCSAKACFNNIHDLFKSILIVKKIGGIGWSLGFSTWEINNILTGASDFKGTANCKVLK